MLFVIYDNSPCDAESLGDLPDSQKLLVVRHKNLLLILAMNITSEYITIDAEDMNAYKGNTYLNRYVTGDYDDLAFTTGMNKLAWVGNVSSMIVKDYSRWI